MSVPFLPNTRARIREIAGFLRFWVSKIQDTFLPRQLLPSWIYSSFSSLSPLWQTKFISHSLWRNALFLYAARIRCIIFQQRPYRARYFSDSCLYQTHSILIANRFDEMHLYPF